MNLSIFKNYYFYEVLHRSLNSEALQTGSLPLDNAFYSIFHSMAISHQLLKCSMAAD